MIAKSKCLNIVMYHYVRDLNNSRYPEIKGLDLSLFKQQIKFLNTNFNIISPEMLIDAVENNTSLPDKSILLTFDDGYIDHYTNVFPVLKEYNLSGVFSVPAKVIEKNKVLDVNKIHFLLASVKAELLLNSIYEKLNYYRDKQFNYPSNEELYQKLAIPNRFDSAEIIFIKRLLQCELPEALRNIITDELFTEYIPISEVAMANELYMNLDQMKLMKNEGMHFAYHGYDHYWMNHINDDKKLIADIDKALKFFHEIIDPNRWICCYPYGSYDENVINIIKSKGAILGLSTDVKQANLNADSLFKLPRFDTNDFPPKSNNFENLIL